MRGGAKGSFERACPWIAGSSDPAASPPLTRSLYNNILPPSRLATGADIHLFREGIEPKWEDPACAGGGKWSFLIPRGSSGSAAQLLDTNWLHVVSLGVLKFGSERSWASLVVVGGGSGKGKR